eukprot:11012747-Lingulodinium_polyedra.AAC.1
MNSLMSAQQAHASMHLTLAGRAEGAELRARCTTCEHHASTHMRPTRTHAVGGVVVVVAVQCWWWPR